MAIPWRGPAVVAAALVVVLPLWALPTATATAAASAMHAAATLTAIVLMLRSVRRSDAASRPARLLFAASLSASATGAVLSAVVAAFTGHVAVPSAIDGITLMCYPLAALGFWCTPQRDGSHRADLRRLLADGAVAATSLLFLSWLFVLVPLSHSGRWDLLGTSILLAYPVFDALLMAMVLSLLLGVRADLRPLLNRVAAGLALITLGDSASAASLAGTGEWAFGWHSGILLAGLCLLARAASTPAGRPCDGADSASLTDRALPYAPVLLCAVGGLWHVAHNGPLQFADTAVGAAMLAAVVVRQFLSYSDLQAVADEHRHAADHDPLTGLANRRRFFARLDEHLRTPGAGPAAVVLLDLDGFKEVNDTLGHDAGDRLLVSFAARLRERAGDHLLARLGGDEFAVLLTGDHAPSDAEELAGDLTVSRQLPATPVLVQCSAGVAPGEPGDVSTAVLHRADLAMYAAKRCPDNRVAVWSSALDQQAERRHLLSAALAGVEERGELSLVYQPLYRLHDGELTGAEALLRWKHPLFGAVPPDEFVPLAEEAGHMPRIGAWVLEQALRQTAAWDREGHHLGRLFVNVSAVQCTPELPATVLAALRRHGVTPGRLVLEITESQLPGLAANEAVQRLREVGVQVALDDFGAGWSSLGQLARMPVDIVKIDREFVRGLDEERGRRVMGAVVQLATALGLSTVAEGIEDLGQAAEATNAGVDLGQGYLFSRPVAPDELAERLPAPPRPLTPGLIPAQRVAARPLEARSD